VEDIGICLGKAFFECVGDKKGIARYGSAFIPLDEALAFCCVDVGGRAFCACELPVCEGRVGQFETATLEEFFRAFAANAQITLHLRKEYGENGHHVIEAAFKAYLPEVAGKFEAGKDFYGTPQEKDFIDEIYASCQNISIDYGIMEKSSNVYVICAEFGWTDLGTWGSLYEISKKDEQGNSSLKCATEFFECENNIVVLENGKLAVVQGLNDSIVVERDGILLICKKNEEQRIRQFVNELNIKYEGKYN
jgi:hypothetical protein